MMNNKVALNKIDFLAVGDITTDVFIKLKDFNVHCNLDNQNCEICLKYGDKVPFENTYTLHAVGNSPNAAVAASKIGLSSVLISSIGNDENGRDCLFELSKKNVDTSYMVIYSNINTNLHYVLWYPPERTILLKHNDFEYSIPQNLPPVDYLYLSSVGAKNEKIHNDIVEYKKNNTNTKIVFQPGTFQILLGKDRLSELYKNTEIFVCNLEEAKRILLTEKEDPIELLDMLSELGPKISIITNGPNGAYASNKEKKYFIPIYPDPKPPYERTGCGDSFTSTFVGFTILGMSFEDALIRSPINPMSVVQYVGAQEGLLSVDQIEKYLKEAPENYKLSEI